MLAGLFSGPGALGLREVPEPTLTSPDQVLVAVEVAGICGTDLHIVSTPQLHPAIPGIVLGHEFVGRVVEVGPAVVDLRPGQRVIAGPNIWCGQCDACRRGRRKQCHNNLALGISCDGGFAPLVAAPARVLYPVPDGLSPELAVFAEPLSCCANGMARLVAAGATITSATVLIQGAGPIGQYFTRLFRHAGAGQIIVSEVLAHRREMARQGGADRVLDPRASSVIEVARELGDGGVAIAVDTVGNLLDESIAAIRPGGHLLVFGMDATCTCEVRPFDIVRNEKSIIGCFVDNDQIPVCLDTIPALGLDALVSHRLALTDIDQAFAALRDASAIKALIYPGERSPDDGAR
jgi:(R,R)-butanediol dehydrogenase/meso-butanediol dehydrogenase/diacetyl reductase